MLKDLSDLLSLTDIGIAFQVRGPLYFIDCLVNSMRRNRGNSFDWLLVLCVFSLIVFLSEVGIPQFEAQSASCATSARAEVAKRFNKLFLAIAQVALRFKENKSFLRFIALRTEKIQ